MDTNSKKFHKIAVAIITLLILLSSLAMTALCSHYNKNDQFDYTALYDSENFINSLVNDSYILYAENVRQEAKKNLSYKDIFYETKAPKNKTEISKHYDYKQIVSGLERNFDETIISYFSELDGAFYHARSYLQYEAYFNESGKKTKDSNTDIELFNQITKGNLIQAPTDYAFGAILSYDKNGNVANAEFISRNKNNATQILNKSMRNFYLPEIEDYDIKLDATWKGPKDCTFVYAITMDALKEFVRNNPYGTTDISDTSTSNTTVYLVLLFLILGLIVGLTALVLPFVKVLDTGDERIFHAPLELVLAVIATLLGFIFSVPLSYWAVYQTNSDPLGITQLLQSFPLSNQGIWFLRNTISMIGWFVTFSLCYWAASCCRQFFTLGWKRYLTERVWSIRILVWFIRVIKHRFIPWLKNTVKKIYNGLLNLDINDNTNRTILKIVAINFAVCSLICIIWVFGIAALLIYSVVLFVFLKKYSTDLKEQYKRLLKATNELAEGNLNGEIPENLGVFEPLREELTKIQSGFKKAVDEEVKSQKMKTDLVTNVSHDLKTPLTAMITYIDLLKEKDLTEEERQTYIDILDKKSNRLKFLIEDLFEISKATSRNVTLNIVNVDIVNLIQQVKMELMDKIESSNLIFRWNLPEEKVILSLDGQKTYRVLENLLVNILKYAMPHTRVYIDIIPDEKQVRILMKNISASELNLNPNEITERFVRGDKSRNTEGSGLGLAIAKSFVELQNGKLNVQTDADLFTVEIIFPR